jgi:anaerobic selenocysteine-containing dehydrogenase
MYTGLEYSNSGVQSARAALTLFALADQLDVPGGIGFTMLNSEFPINRSCNLENPNLDLAIGRQDFPVYSDYRGESHAIALVDSVLRGNPYRTRGLIVQGASLLTSWPQTPIWREMLSRLDFLVCIDRQFTADAAYADIVLPATTMFENYSYMVYGPYFPSARESNRAMWQRRATTTSSWPNWPGIWAMAHLFPQTEEEMLRFVLDGSGYSLEDVRACRRMGKNTDTNAGVQEMAEGPALEETPGLALTLRPASSKYASTILAEYGYEPLPRYIEPTEGPLASPKLAEEFPPGL